MNTLTVDMKVPIEIEPLIAAPALTFSHWLPLGKTNGITVTEDEITLTLWFDLQSTWWASQLSEEDLKRQVNVLAHYIRAEIIVQGVESELASYMQSRDFRRLPTESEKAIQSEYAKLGVRILELLLKRINRLVAYARAFKGQYWLLEYNPDMDRLHGFFQKFEAKGRINNGEAFRFQPGVGDMIHISMTSSDKYIREDEWNKIDQFVRSEQRTPLVFELLTGAEQLAANGYSRSALTEAVTALEVAVASFGRSQDGNGKLASILGSRLGIDRLQRQIDHMGVSGTISYLLPLLLPEAILPADILSDCRDAIDERQNVVHNGKRDVTDAHRFIASIKACCKILLEYDNENTIDRR
jgi:hypothetical protein